MMNMKHGERYFKVAPGVWGMKLVFVNIYVITSDDHWVLVDTGLPGSAGWIIRMANELFDDMPPAAIVLTHGHFDHRGGLPALLKKWNVPVYAHDMELPYLTGKSAYPPPDPTVGGGLMSLLSFLYPKQPINLGERVQALPADGTVPFLPEWEAIFVPGHAPGQVALFRTGDRLLLSADAFVTTRQESAIATLSALPIISGPPKYFTYDWQAALNSVIRLKELLPRRVASGHGLPMYGRELEEGLETLVTGFDELALPKQGRYVNKPAVTDESGVRELPHSSPIGFAALLGAVLVIGLLWSLKYTTIHHSS